MNEDRTVNTGGALEHQILPAEAARLLREAAETPLDPTALDPHLQRRKAVDRAHAQVRARWPQLFRED